MLGKVLVALEPSEGLSGDFIYTEAGAMVIEPEEMPWALHLEDLKWAMALREQARSRSAGSVSAGGKSWAAFLGGKHSGESRVD